LTRGAREFLGCCGWSAAPYMVFQFYYGASGAGAATKKFWIGAELEGNIGFSYWGFSCRGLW
jgi:hypothetical protein